MTIIEALKENSGMVVKYGNRWLVWYAGLAAWEVYEYSAKTTTLVFSGASEAAAVEKLREG